MANLSKASNVVQERYILYDVTGFTQKWHSIPVATNCNLCLDKDRGFCTWNRSFPCLKKTGSIIISKKDKRSPSLFCLSDLADTCSVNADQAEEEAQKRGGKSSRS